MVKPNKNVKISSFICESSIPNKKFEEYDNISAYDGQWITLEGLK